MDIDPIARERNRGRRLVVGPRGEDGISSVYAVVHHQAPELAALPGVDVQQVRAQLEETRETAWRLENSRTEEEREEIRAQLEAAKERSKAALKAELAGTEERAIAYLHRCRAIICSAVQAIGIALDGQEPGPRPYGTRVEEVCRPLTEGKDPVYLRALTIAPDRSDPKLPVSILDYDLEETLLLATFIAGAFSTRSMVTPLSREPRDPTVGGRAGHPVRGEAEPVPAGPGQGGGGNRRSRRAAGKGK